MAGIQTSVWLIRRDLTRVVTFEALGVGQWFRFLTGALEVAGLTVVIAIGLRG